MRRRTQAHVLRGRVQERWLSGAANVATIAARSWPGVVLTGPSRRHVLDALRDRRSALPSAYNGTKRHRRDHRYRMHPVSEPLRYCILDPVPPEDTTSSTCCYPEVEPLSVGDLRTSIRVQVDRTTDSGFGVDRGTRLSAARPRDPRLPAAWHGWIRCSSSSRHGSPKSTRASMAMNGC